MSQTFVKCVADDNGVLIGLTLHDEIVINEDFNGRLQGLHEAGMNEAVAEALLLRRHKVAENLCGEMDVVKQQIDNPFKAELKESKISMTSILADTVDHDLNYLSPGDE